MNVEEKILVINDSKEKRNFLRDFLTSCDYDIETARNTEEALKVMEWYKPVMVIIDMVTPGIDGLECAGKIRKTYPNIPIIFLTSSQMESDMAKAKGLKPEECLKKPYSMSHLEDCIRNLL